MIADGIDEDELARTIEELNPDALLYEGFNAALVGFISRAGTSPLALYDREKCIEVLMARDMTYQQAEEFFCFNIEGCWAGPHTPFIASFNLDPIGIRYPVEDLQVSAGDSAETEILLGFDSDGNARADFANIGAGVVNSASHTGGPIGPSDGDEVSAGPVVVDRDVKS
tara:strand:+ start:274 stop:780 length:507 start_codon:yes stop_codon:yes gene_type:complete